MSSARCSRNSSEKGVLGLNDEEIQEEMLNANLKDLGIAEDDIRIMATQEKENLLAAIKQSTSPQPVHENNPRPKSKQTSESNNEEPNPKIINSNPADNEKNNEIVIFLDNPDEYPPLQSSYNNGKRVFQRRQQSIEQKDQQQQPKKTDVSINVNAFTNSRKEESNDDDSSEDEYLSDYEQSFSIPGFIDDNGSNLNDSARKMPIVRAVHYYNLPGQSNREGVKSMLRQYNAWYKVWCSLEKCNSSVDETNTCDDIVVKYSSDDVQEEIASLSSDSNQSMNLNKKDVYINDVKSPMRKSNSDTEEVEITEISDSSNPKQLTSTKAKTLPRDIVWRYEQTPRSSSTPTIALNFDEKWDPDTGTWNSQSNKRYSSPGPSYSASTMNTPHHNNSLKSVNRQKTGADNLRKRTSQEVHYQLESPRQEPKVQCPICQLDFLQSKVESHAAVCEGFPSETRSNASSTSTSKVEESNNKDEVINNAAEDSNRCNSEFKVANKRRAKDSEDQKSTKRVCVNRL